MKAVILAFLRNRELFRDLSIPFQDKVVEDFIILQTGFIPQGVINQSLPSPADDEIGLL
jgi:hypothetical protein